MTVITIWMYDVCVCNVCLYAYIQEVWLASKKTLTAIGVKQLV